MLFHIWESHWAFSYVFVCSLLEISDSFFKDVLFCQDMKISLHSLDPETAPVAWLFDVGSAVISVRWSDASF